jgi:3-hydroxy-9,10-secoandrosta-1,3,5(10)-triene-9,17-dione monooxygenase
VLAASLFPNSEATPADGGYRLSGEAPFASGIAYSSWVFVGGHVVGDDGPEWTVFLVPPGAYTVRDTWFTAGMRATGSSTIVTDGAFVPAAHTVRLADLREGRGPGAALHDGPIYRAPFIAYAPLTFAAPMLGAAQGAYEHFREWTKTRSGPGGVPVAEITSIQVRLARTAADLDAAEMLLRRGADAAQSPGATAPALRARSMRDFARASEIVTGAIDTLMAMSGTAGFTQSHPIQRAWRDIHFAATHVSLNPELSFAHFGRTEFGLPRDPGQPFF